MATPPKTWLSTAEFAAVAGKVRRDASRILARCHEGQSWRGQRLVVRMATGGRGRGGVRYEVRLDSLPSELQERWQPNANLPAIIAPAALPALVEKLPRKERSDRGGRRVLISREVDRFFDRHSIDLQTRKDIVSKLEKHVASLWANGVPGWPKVQRFATKQAMNLIAEAIPGVRAEQLGKAHRVPRAFIERFREFAVVHVAETDAKQFYDRYLPRVRRAHPGLRPMEMVAGDVHPVDIACRREDGSAAHPRMIAWLDVATRRVFVSLVLCDPGTGIRQEHVIESFIAMVAAWGLPSSLYLDNGGEYNWTHFIEDAMALTKKGLKFHVGTGENTRRALPYNARAKFIETFFAVWERNYASMIPGWRGGDRMRSKVANVGQRPPVFPGTFEQFESTIQDTIAFYHTEEQSGALKGRTPNEALDLAVQAGWRKIVIDPEELVTVFAREMTRVVGAGGVITIGNVEYEDPRLALLSGKRLRCRVPMTGEGSFISVVLGDGRVFVCARRPVFGVSDRRGAKHRSTQIAAVKRRLNDMRGQTEKLDLVALMRDAAADSPPVDAPTGAVVSISGEAASEARARAEFNCETPTKKLTDVEKYHLRRQGKAAAAGSGWKGKQ